MRMFAIHVLVVDLKEVRYIIMTMSVFLILRTHQFESRFSRIKPARREGEGK